MSLLLLFKHRHIVASGHDGFGADYSWIKKKKKKPVQEFTETEELFEEVKEKPAEKVVYPPFKIDIGPQTQDLLLQLMKIDVTLMTVEDKLKKIQQIVAAIILLTDDD